MLRRVRSSYLWVSPLAFVALAALYHGVSFWVGLAGGVVHLALVGVALQANGVFNRRDPESGDILGATNYRARPILPSLPAPRHHSPTLFLEQ
jgi:hypothetical protein